MKEVSKLRRKEGRKEGRKEEEGGCSHGQISEE
jgi:hypothetical protein